MAKKNQKKTQPKGLDKLLQSLGFVLADTYALTAQTHLAHWNVEGRSFFQLHGAFEEQYDELFEATDEIAERIRALGGLAPGGLRTLSELSKVKEIKPTTDASVLLEGLIAAHEATVQDLKVARDLAADLDDKETEDLCISRIQWHQKILWMLKSSR